MLMKLLCFGHVKLAFFPIFNLNGANVFLFLKFNSAELVSGLGPNSGHSILECED